MNFTADEVQAAVEKIVRSTVRHPTGILGERNISVSFNDLQEAAAGVYILYFNAPFYTVMLGARRLADLVEAQANTAELLLDAVFSTDRLTTPVSDLSPLANARSALGELEAAVASRSSGFADINQVPAFRRYAASIQSFLDTAGTNVKGPSAGSSAGSGSSDGVQQIVDTPAGARLKIPSLATQLRDQHTELIRRAKLLAGALADFAALNLPRVAAAGVISRARAVLDEHYTTLSELTEDQRLESLRGVVLDLLTQKPLVQKYGAALAPSEFITTSGQAVAFSDATHLATPAFVTSEIFGPYPIVDGFNVLALEVDGTPIEFPLPVSLVAELQGTLTEPFGITSSNNALRILFDSPDAASPATYDVPLTIGTRTAAEVAADINAVIGATDLICEETFYPLKYSAPVTITSLGGTDARFTILAGSLSGLNLLVGDEVDVLEGANSGTTWTVTAVDPSGLFVDATGAAAVTPEAFPGVAVEMGPAARALRLRDVAPGLSVSVRRAVRLVRTGGVEDFGAGVLGWFPGAEMRSRPVAARALATYINTSTSLFKAEASFVATHYSGVARTSAEDAGMVVLSKAILDGTVDAGTTVTFTVAAVPELLEVGDRAVIRSSLTVADVGQEGEITSLTDTTITLLFADPITAGSVNIEFGPNVVFEFGDVLNITTGVNAGRYVVRESQGVGTTCTFEVLLESALPTPKDGSSSLPLEVTFGGELLRFSSRLEQVSSEVVVQDTVTADAAGNYFFDPAGLPATAQGTTSYLQFENFPAAQVGDLVLLYESQYNEASRTFSITGVEQGSSVLQISPEIESASVFSFDFDVPPPFGRIRVAQVADFDLFKSRLNTWVSLPAQQDSYFRDLARLLNPLLTNTNPTAVQVNDAATQLKKLMASLTAELAAAYGSLVVPAVTGEDALGFALSEYTAPVEEPVDVLLSSFRNKGADRAIDLLVEGQFSTFFNLDSDGVSYSGTLLSSLREMGREDLPVRKFDRREFTGSKSLGVIPDEKDFEYTADDADSPDLPDIPAGADVSTPGENY